MDVQLKVVDSRAWMLLSSRDHRHIWEFMGFNVLQKHTEKDTVRKSGAAYALAVQALLQKIPQEQLAAWEAKYVALLQSEATADKGDITKALAQAVGDLALAEKADPQFKNESDLVISKITSYSSAGISF
jgi:hypothetical protein